MYLFNLFNQDLVIKNIQDGTIQLYDDHTGINIHFKYKDIEVKSDLNAPYPYRVNYNPERLIDQTQWEKEYLTEKVPEDFYREIKIFVKIDEYFALLDGDEEDDDIEDVSDDEDSDDEDIVQKFSPGVFLTDSQKKGYAKAAQRVPVLEYIMDDENNDLYSFVSKYGLKIMDEYIQFYAPGRAKTSYEWMAYSCLVIDKFLNYFKEEEDDEDDYDDLVDDED